MDAFIFSEYQEEHPSEPVWNAEVLVILLCELFPQENNNFQYQYPSTPVREQDP